MTDIPSFQDLLNDFADEVFVGRGEQLSLFENEVKAVKPSFLILNISGQGGLENQPCLNVIVGYQRAMGYLMHWSMKTISQFQKYWKLL